MFIHQAISELKTLILQSPYAFIQNQEKGGNGFENFDARLCHMAAMCIKNKIPQSLADIKAACQPTPSYMPSTAVKFAMNAKAFKELKQQVAKQYAAPNKKLKF